MHMRVQFKDAAGVEIDGFTTSPEDAIARIAEFVRLHGTDPDCDGKDASAGFIFFSPC